MAFTVGFWVPGTVGNATNMNYCLLGWGLYSEFPAAAAGNKGALALATDRNQVYYSNGTAWTLAAIAPPATPTQGDIIYFNGTAWAKLAAGTSGQVLTTYGAGANPAWAAGPGVSGAQTQPGYILNTNYQNTSGKAKLVSINVTVSTAPGGINCYSKSTSPPNTLVGTFGSNSSGEQGTCTFIVPNTYYYRATTSGTTALNSWTEWAL